mgnify:CR=1 FL=1
MDNKKAIQEGMAKFYRMLYERAYDAFIGIGDDILHDAQVSAQYHNLTGNTLTSLAFGLYQNYQLVDVTFLDGVKPAIRRKLRKEEWFRGRTYDKVYRKFQGTVETDGGWGTSTSMQFLKTFKPIQPYSIVVCTGTEYSELLENEKDLNVLTDTKQYTAARGLSMFRNGFKKIK